MLLKRITQETPCCYVQRELPGVGPQRLDSTHYCLNDSWDQEWMQVTVSVRLCLLTLFFFLETQREQRFVIVCSNSLLWSNFRFFLPSFNSGFSIQSLWLGMYIKFTRWTGWMCVWTSFDCKSWFFAVSCMNDSDFTLMGNDWSHLVKTAFTCFMSDQFVCLNVSHFTWFIKGDSPHNRVTILVCACCVSRWQGSR